MTHRIVFQDLGGPVGGNRNLRRKDEIWLSDLASELDAHSLAVPIKGSFSKYEIEPEPVLTRQPDGSWRAGRFVGEIRRGDTILEIQPRLSFPVIAEWASAALNLRIVSRAAGRNSIAFLIAELQAATWRRALADASRHGMPAIRSSQRHEGPTVLGRFDLAATLPLRMKRSPNLVSVTQPKVVDNPVTRAIVLADRVLNSRIQRTGWRGPRVEELIPHLRSQTGTRPVLPTRRELRSVRYTPITQPYRAVAEMSWMIAKNRGPHGDGSSDTYDGVLLDIAELWELFLLHCIRIAADGRTVTHGTRAETTSHLLHSTSGERPMGRLLPDFIVGETAQPDAIIDAKYKRLTDPFPVQREDLYQLTSYLAAHSGSQVRPRGILAYPFLPDSLVSSAESGGPWSLQWGGGGTAEFLRFPTDQAGCVAKFVEVFDFQ
ncbi:hypothetical protein BH686_16770 [Rhodococcus erythropolis]|uniref:5-methylcytosine restriction system specificity protein McrC n=1 Tax=Rhodococcus erythropolis TaxID=1833 RepID=UPI0009FE0F70|nr:hypothetical protein [Rhodococcus erythropolis]ORI22051.1 hypothetical protein BH686_16770 [Rhodococcus erythropolis]